jgi:imidazolonepropionase
MIPCDLLIHSAAQALTLTSGHHRAIPQRGLALGELRVLADGAVAIRGDRILAVGPSPVMRRAYQARTTLDAAGRVIMPGFVDPHTHAVWMGDRANEFAQRIAGQTYLDIMQAGGGIMSTVRQTRAASVDQLVEAARPRLKRMLAHGTTTIEIKTGYGLDLAAELRMLKAIERLNAEGPWLLHPTFLGAHAIPAEYAGRADDYVEVVVHEMLPAVWEWWLGARPKPTAPEPIFVAHRPPPIFCDVFCEAGAFTVAQSRRILERAKELGFGLKIHADEFVGLGGTQLAVELGARSADHLVYTPEADIAALGAGETVAVALPGTPFGLAQKDYTPAQQLLQANGILALASDLNPGTSWCESMQMVIALACRYLRLTPAQAIVAATLNAAHAIKYAYEVGTLESGKRADVLILNVPDYNHLGYRYGTNLVQTVIAGGQVAPIEK